MKLSKSKQQKSYENTKTCYICKEKFEGKYAKDEKHCKSRDHFQHTGKYRGAARSICNLKQSIPKKVLWFFTVDQTIIITLS